MTPPYRIKRPAILDQIPHDRHAVIEASAGTGKTYTIERLVVELLLAFPDLRIGQILVVTFTEKATAELKGRIRKLLKQIVDADAALVADDGEPAWEIGPGERRRLERALFAFDQAPIHTIHGFCQRVLTEHAFQNHRLFDQEHVDFDALFDRVFKRALRSRFAVDADYEPYLRAWLDIHGGSVESLQKLLGTCLRSRAELRPRFDRQALVTALEAFGDRSAEAIVEAVHSDLKEAGTHGRTANAVCDRVTILCEGIASFQRDGGILDFLACVAHKKVQEYLPAKLVSEDFSGPCARLVAAAFEAAVPLEAAIVDTFLPPLRELMREVKETEGLFSYDDMLSLVWESLDSERAPALLEVLRGRFRFGLIDEFQDTDDLQWRIFRRVFYESDGQNIFYLIGDPKQAIYGFRGADVYTYLEARRTVADAGGAVVPLAHNYRSSPGVIAAYNHLLDQTAAEPFFTGDIRYDEPVVCGRPDCRATGPDGQPVAPVRVIRPVTPDGDKSYAHRLKDALGARYAREIAGLLSDDGALTIDDGDGSEPRRLRAKDVYVLTRSGNEGREIAAHLRREGVPFAFFKQDGLFQTPEAQDVLDVLAAVDEPHDHARRLKAWLTPVFALGLANLAALDDVDDSDPLVADLYRWAELAGRRQFEQMFHAIAADSGMLRREVFAKDSERELTNYLHIFEILLEEAEQGGLDLGDLIARLRRFIDGQVTPEGDDGNVQRLESEREAVQIMTMHKAKGLEADVVFVYGGFSSGFRGDVYRFHDADGSQVLHIGRLHGDDKDRYGREEREEDQRLLYVALTRAKNQLVLPHIGTDADGKHDYERFNGTYRVLNDRLDAVVAALDEDDAGVHFAYETVVWQPDQDATLDEEQRATLRRWQPPEPVEPAVEPAALDPLRGRRHLVTSYSRLKGQTYARTDAGLDEFRVDQGPPAADLLGPDALPPGPTSGVFLHYLMETLDPALARRHDALDGWMGDAEVVEQFDRALRRFRIAPKYRDYCMRAIWLSLTTPVAVAGGSLGRVCDVDTYARELEFVYPIPEHAHPDFGTSIDGRLIVEHGYVRGFIDLLIEVDGRVYFADWKGDVLADYGPQALRAHVADRYDVQASLYALAVARMLGLDSAADCRRRLGGYLYLFMRGMGTGEPGTGVFYDTVGWDELVGWDRQLRDRDAFWRARRLR